LRWLALWCGDEGERNDDARRLGLPMQLVCLVEASYAKGEFTYGDQEGSEEVIRKEKQCEEVEFLTQVQSVGE
jgi:hypothetical protein